MISGTQAAIGCVCGNPGAMGVMHRSEGQCLATYVVVGSSGLQPTCARLDKGSCGCTAYCGEYWRRISGKPLDTGPAPNVTVSVVYPPSAEEIDYHLDVVLRAAGSALRHYSMQKSKDDMRAAMRAAMERRRDA